MQLAEIDEYYQYELEMEIDEFPPGEIFSIFEMFKGKIDYSTGNNTKQYSAEQLHGFDKNFLAAVESGEVQRVKWIGTDDQGNGIYEKVNYTIH